MMAAYKNYFKNGGTPDSKLYTKLWTILITQLERSKFARHYPIP